MIRHESRRPCTRWARRPRTAAAALLVLALAATAMQAALVPRVMAIDETTSTDQSGRRSGDSARGNPAGVRDADRGSTASESGAGLAVQGGRASATGDGPQLSTLKRVWLSAINSPIIRRLRSVGSWVTAFLRFLASIPRAILQGESDAMMEALGDLLSKASAEEPRAEPAAGSDSSQISREPSSSAGPGSAMGPAR